LPSRQRRRSSRGDDRSSGSHERWLVTYADMITLLMAFFIMLYGMSIINLGKFQQLAVSVRSGFHGEMPQMGAAGIVVQSGGGQPSILPANQMPLMRKIATQVRHGLETQQLMEGVEVHEGDDRVTVRLLAGGLLFECGSADLQPRVQRILDEVAKAILEIPQGEKGVARVQVEGHTCDLPINTPRFPSNWELSTARATNVVGYFLRVSHVPPELLSAVGYADTQSIAPNDSEENRGRNRRVDIVILAHSALDATEYTAPPEPGEPEAQTDEAHQ
jgi:chemotaxis protein MotB